MTATLLQTICSRLPGLAVRAARGVRHVVQRLAATVLLLWCADAASMLAADDGVEADTITFGQTAALEGPAARLGVNMRAGILAAFEEANANGGIYGRKLRLVSYNDNYEPTHAIRNTERLLGEDKVFALIGSVGTPTSIATAPIAQARGVPFIGPFTGAEALRSKDFSMVVNLRASYEQEADRIVEWLAGSMEKRSISVFYQDDSFGKAGLIGVKRALEKRDMDLAGSGAYERNTVAVKRALLEIRRTETDAVILVSAYEPAAAFIKWAHKLGMDVPFVCLSFVGTNALSSAIDDMEDVGFPSIYVSQVVPNVAESKPPVLVDYRKAAYRQFPDLGRGFVSLEGYLVGRMAIDALQRAGSQPTRQGFIDAIYSQPLDIGGFLLTYGAGDNQGSDSIFLTKIEADGTTKTLTEAAE